MMRRRGIASGRWKSGALLSALSCFALVEGCAIDDRQLETGREPVSDASADARNSSTDAGNVATDGPSVAPDGRNVTADARNVAADATNGPSNPQDASSDVARGSVDAARVAVDAFVSDAAADGGCDGGFKRCGGSCVRVSDPAYGCGPNTCDNTSCPAAGDGTLACESTTCVIGTCGAGSKKCGVRCVLVADPSYGCGATTCDATSCPAPPAGGTLACAGGACVVGVCGPGTKKCGDKCVPTDRNNGCADPVQCTACAASETCAGTPSICTAKKPLGAACTTNEQCALGFCVDGVCCNSACNGVCVSCRAAQNGQAADGTCASIVAGTDPANECAADTTTCGLDGFCGGGRCRFAPATTPCAASSCTSATLIAAKSCDGSGACPTADASSPCAGNVVCASATACKSPSCAADADCVGGFFCASGACRAKLPVGMACSANTQCQDANCSSDGVCCSTSCAAACQACRTVNTGVPTGTCAPRSGTAQCNGACGTGFTACGTTCVSRLWNFDQGPVGGARPYGWFYSDIDNEFPQVQITYVSGVSHTAAANPGALGVHLPAINGSGANIVFAGAFCSAGIPLAGKTLTAFVSRSAQASGTPLSTPANYGSCVFYLDNSNGAFATFVAATAIPLQGALWTRMSGVVPETATGLFDKLQLTCSTPLIDPAWDGTLYLDDISISP